jgi:hypothetical protein
MGRNIKIVNGNSINRIINREERQFHKRSFELAVKQQRQESKKIYAIRAVVK